MSPGRKIVLSLVIIFIAIQFIQPAKNKREGVSPADIINHFQVPEKVATILKSSCYDCHSNNTSYPWYASIQPIAWWMAKHIKEGKEVLNFNEFGSLSGRRQQSKIKAIFNNVKDASMPLSSYILLHPSAKLTKENKAIVMEWATKISAGTLSKKRVEPGPQ
jgi:hypothetical protein